MHDMGKQMRKIVAYWSDTKMEPSQVFRYIQRVSSTQRVSKSPLITNIKKRLKYLDGKQLDIWNQPNIGYGKHGMNRLDT